MHHVLAYIDPGSGSLAIQALIAAVIAAPFLARQQVGRFVRTLRRQSSQPESTLTSTTDTDQPG